MIALLAAAGGPGQAPESMRYAAFSLRTAQHRIEQARGNWRARHPEVRDLAGINQVDGLVFEESTGDLILVGHEASSRGALTLDDLVVAFRARLVRHEWPSVSLGPATGDGQTQTLQVRFKGGIEDTAMGQTLLSADCRLNELGEVTGDFYQIAAAEPCLLRLLGLQELVAVSRVLEELEPMPDLAWWLDKYRTDKVWIEKRVKTPRRSAKTGERLEMSGGIRLTALSTSLAASDAKGLKAAVLGSRPSRDALSWSFGGWSTAPTMEPAQADGHALLILRAEFLRSQGRHEDALAVLDQALKLNPGQAGAWAAKGRALAGLGRGEEALSALGRALEISPRDAGIWQEKGAVLRKLGLVPEAVDSYDRALEIHPGQADTWSMRGVALADLGRYEDALVSLGRALQIDPANAETWYHQALFLAVLGRYTEAQSAMEKAAQLGHDVARAALRAVKEKAR